MSKTTQGNFNFRMGASYKHTLETNCWAKNVLHQNKEQKNITKLIEAEAFLIISKKRKKVEEMQ